MGTDRSDFELFLRRKRSELLRASRDELHNRELALLGAEILGLIADEENAYEGGGGKMAGMIADEMGEPDNDETPPADLG